MWLDNTCGVGAGAAEGVGDTDLALDGIKGTEAGFKFDLMVGPVKQIFSNIA